LSDEEDSCEEALSSVPRSAFVIVAFEVWADEAVVEEAAEFASVLLDY
jgi:hypothetical protein